MLRLFTFLLLLPVFSTLQAQPCDCLTTGNCPVPIQDNGTFQGTLDVTVNGQNDLSQCQLTSLCFSITHTWVGELCVTLTSPGGLNYMVMADANNNFGGCGNQMDNVDICIVPGTGTPVTNNTEYMCNSGPCSSGTCCLTGNWTMPCGGVTDPVTGAQQAPGCDLNDFNQPGQPANGTWTLTVNDICASDVGSLNNFSLTFACGTLVCTVCEANGGGINAPNAQGCFGSPSLNLNLPPQYGGANGPAPPPGEYGYAYVVSQGGTIMQVNPTADMSSQPQGVYQVCGFSYLQQAAGQLPTLIGMNLQTAQTSFASTTAPFCGDFSTGCVTVTIGPPIPPTNLIESVCLGECIMVGNQQVCQSGTITLQSYLGCDSVINVVITPILPPQGAETITVCQGECVIFNAQQYCPPGPHIVVFQSAQGCDSIVTLTLIEEVTSAIINPPNPPPLSCNNPTAVLDGSLSLPIGGPYSWTGPGGFSSTEPIVAVSAPGTYTLTILNNSLNPPCVSSTSVEVLGTQAQPDLVINNPPAPICAGGSFDLSTLSIQDLNNTSPVITFHSATPATPANQVPSTIVSPLVTTTYYILGTSGGCTDEISVTLTVNPAPTSDFTAISPICATASSTVIYTGNAGPGATYAWDFNGGTATPGTGPGPHTVTWPTAGLYNISLTVTENGCASLPTQQSVIVEQPLLPPTISCGAITATSVEFVWDNVAGASSYTVVVTSGQTGGAQIGNTYIVPNLTPGESVTIEVTASSSGVCGSSSATFTCTSESCPPVTIAISPVADICLQAATPAVDLTATVTGGSGGTETWSGMGIIDPVNGIFDPNVAGLGAHVITFTYEEDACPTSETITIDVVATPTASFTVTSPICRNESATVTYTGNAGAGATFAWNFNAGSASPGTGAGPHSVSWATAGTKTITLTVTENGCASAPFSQTVEVDPVLTPPVINCSSSQNSVTFTWAAIANAASYNVNVLTGQTGTFIPPTSYEVTGLNPGDVVTISVEAVSGNACPNSSAQSTCTAQDCPPVTVAIDTVADICLNASASSFDLVASQTGGLGGGTFTWSGPGITDPANGTFDPALADIGENDIQVVYEEGSCPYNASIIINVYAEPTANFTVVSPVCITGSSTITYTGTATNGATYNWDFGGGTATPGTGQGPQSVSWPSAGTQTVTLEVTENGCTSPVFSQNIVTEEPLTVPIIDCNTTTTSIEFFWNSIPGATGYAVNVISGASGVSTSDTTYLVTGLNPGDQATIEVTASNSGPCGNSSAQQTCTAQDCPPLPITITPVDDICLMATTAAFDLESDLTGNGTISWSGNGITDPAAGTFDPQVAGVGAHLITLTYEEGNCLYTQDITINVFPTPTANFTTVSPVCENEISTITFTGTAGAGSIFTWDFDGGTATPGTGQGPHNVTWTTSGAKIISLSVENTNSCISTIYEDSVQVDKPLVAPIISCNSTISSVEFTWPDVAGATDYQVVVLAGQTGTQTSQNAYEVTGLLPLDEVTIELTVSGNGACPPVTAQATCIAQDCADILVEVQAVAPICLASATSQALTATVTGGDGTGIGTWSGPGVTGSDFDATVAGVGQHVIVYTFLENNCTYIGSTTIEVFDAPSATFTADAVICINDATTITYSGNAAANATYSWNFGGGTATPGTGAGPHQVTWANIGNQTISLTVEQDGCTSAAVEQQVQVDAELTPPDIDCITNTTSIEFTWPDVAGATDYEVTILAGTSGTQTSQNAYFIDGLVPGDMVTLQLTVSGNTACPPVIATQTCTAQDCPDIQLAITPVGPICLTQLAEQVNLEVAITGGDGTGTGTWSGIGVVDPTAGVFDPNVAGLGNQSVTFVYEESSCSYDASLQIQLVAPPVADAGADAEITCKENEMDAELGGSNTSTGTQYSYDWSVSTGAFPGDSTTLTPIVSQPGTYTLTVINTALGCSATDVVVVAASQQIPVPQVQISSISCFGENDGAISVTSVSGGEEPYLFSFNGSTFSSSSNFTSLMTGIYELTVLDGAGCENTLTINVLEPPLLNVELLAFIEGNIVILGDSVHLQGLVTIPEDSLDLVQWQPDSLLSCPTCLSTTAFPLQTTTFSLTVESNGCKDSDEMTLFVKKNHPVFVPNAFSPNGDGQNDFFTIFAGKEVKNIKTFLVFNRWGETVYRFENFLPNNPAFGWDGSFRGKPMNPAVFTWFAEIEFVDGDSELFEGDVTLLR